MPGEMHRKYDKYAKTFESFFNMDTPKDNVNLSEIPEANTSLADYVWLPFRFEGNMAYMDWMDEWKIEDYE